MTNDQDEKLFECRSCGHQEITNSVPFFVDGFVSCCDDPQWYQMPLFFRRTMEKDARKGWYWHKEEEDLQINPGPRRLANQKLIDDLNEKLQKALNMLKACERVEILDYSSGFQVCPECEEIFDTELEYVPNIKHICPCCKADLWYNGSGHAVGCELEYLLRDLEI